MPRSSRLLVLVVATTAWPSPPSARRPPPRPASPFPISAGEVDAATLAGQISHRGGLSFTSGDRTLRVTQFVIDNEESVLSARLFRFGPRIPLLDLDLSGITVTPGDDSVVVSGVGATLTPVAARALNLYFGTHLFTGGLPVGTATVDAELG